MSQSSIVVNANEATIRIALRVYFTVAFALISFLGARCCDSRVRLLLLKDKSIPVLLTTSWLSGPSAVIAWFQQRQPPAGKFMGPLMILLPIVAISSDVLVSGLVGVTSIPDRCEFGTGLVIPPERQPINASAVPGYPQKGAEIAEHAQLISLQNGGLSGIFWKTNTSPKFRAEPQDVAGHWQCDVAFRGAVDDPGLALTQNRTKVALDLVEEFQSNGTLYATGYPSARWCVQRGGLLPTGGFMYLSTSQTALNQLWDLKVAVDNAISQRDCGVWERTLSYTVYDCSMHVAPSVEWLMRNVDSRGLGDSWVELIYSRLWAGDYDGNAGQALAAALTVLIMLAYAGHVNVTETPWGDTSIGCLRDVATIPWAIMCLVVLVGLMVLMLGIYWAAILVYTRRLSRESPAQETEMPSGLLPWMKYAVLVSSDGTVGQRSTSELGKWSLVRVVSAQNMLVQLKQQG